MGFRSCQDRRRGGATGDSPVTIGGGGNNYFNGKIDDVRIYNRVLSASEVKSLYISGVP
jgi:hypothetical protein